MTIEELGNVLAVAAAFDNRTVGEADILAWNSAIGHIGADEARDAVIAHYTESTDRLMPAHVLARVRKIRAARIADDPDALPDADPDDDIAYRAALREGRFRKATGLAPRPIRQAIERTFRHVPSAWDRNATVVPRALPAGTMPPPPDDPEHAAAQAVLNSLPDAQRWIVAARAELEAEGARLGHAAVTIRAAELATRPEGT